MDREAVLKQFDKNGDGELDDNERQALREEMQKRLGNRGGPRGRREERN